MVDRRANHDATGQLNKANIIRNLVKNIKMKVIQKRFPITVPVNKKLINVFWLRQLH